MVGHAAIVGVGAGEKHVRNGLAPREAAHRTMREVSGALIAIGLGLVAVFVPTAFVSGITGIFYRQFAVTIAAASLISLRNSLTLAPAIAAAMMKPHKETEIRREERRVGEGGVNKSKYRGRPYN